MSKTKTVEEKYKKMSQVEHILNLPDSYIGSIEKSESEQWVFENNTIIKKIINITPGFYKIFDEIIVNAIDHYIRLKNLENEGINKVTRIKVSINQETNTIEVYNDGDGIDIEKHKEYNIYAPELIFGHLLTSENYDKSEKKITGGKNGYGAKLTNIYSKEFIIETVDFNRKKKYIQKFENNMSIKGKPKITVSSMNPYTRITFKPDLERFDMKSLDNDILSLMYKRVYDISACTDSTITVSLNNTVITCKGFEKYINMYIGANRDNPRVYERINEHWEIAVSTSLDDKFEQVSFVNGIATTEGGKHIDHVSSKISKKLVDYLTSKKKKTEVKQNHIKDNMFIFCRCNIVNPSFSSQTKTQLTTVSTKFGTKFDVSDDFIEKIYKKTNILTKAISLSEYKLTSSLSKSDGKKKSIIRGIPKLDDAIWAGSKKSNECTLILTEGDSCSSNTPLLLRKDGLILIKTIDDINNSDWIDENGKLHSTSDYEIWSDKGWTNINYVMKHKVNKRMFKVLTHTGYVEVTEDHSLLNKHGREITPKECKVGNELLHSFPKFTENKLTIPNNLKDLKVKEIRKYASKANIQYYQKLKKDELISKLENIQNDYYLDINNINNDIQSDEAYVMGLFFTDGCSNIYEKNKVNSYYWAIDNTDLNLLEKSKNILEKYYDIEFKITIHDNSNKENHKQMYRLLAYGEKKIESYVKKYMNIFYDKNRCKKVSKLILNSNRDIRQQFFKGFYDGYDSNTEKSVKKRFDINGQIGAHGLFYLCKSLGYQVSINCRLDKPDIYILNLTSKYSYQQLNPNKIKKIIDLGIKECYVYDIETNNHHFQGGIGELIVHNSAKSFAVSGLSIIGTNKYGVFPLKGKLLNVRDATDKRVGENDEINNLKKILGLQQYQSGTNKAKIYKDVSELRYGSIMILTDADVDGSHIKGLIMNLFHYYWPSLLNINGFIKSMMTPVIKLIKKNDEKSFYTLGDFEKWQESNSLHGWKVSYYKGLGTSTSKEAKSYFKEMDKNLISYVKDDDIDSSINLAFNKRLTDDRKNWLKGYNKQDTISNKVLNVSITDFVNKDLIHFSNYDNERSIPSICDGLKPSQRKVIYVALLRNLKHDIKVSEFAGSVSENSAYHHGEASLFSTIISMSQNFVGSNNINLLEPKGQFGTRLLGGKDSASPRYIKTCLSQITKILYNEHDLNLLEYLEDDGSQIEPKYFIPILPMILINGTEGIGTGFSTKVPMYNPLDIINNLLLIMSNKPLIDMMPWYRGFCGNIIKEDNKILSKGLYKINKIKNLIEITELPIGTWTEDYKGYLEKITIDKSSDKKSQSSQYINNYIYEASESTVKIILSFPSDIFEKIINDKETLEKVLKIIDTKNTSITNMHLHDKNNCIKKYTTVNKILKEFYEIRLNFYDKRKIYLINKFKHELEILAAKIKFINGIIKDEINIYRKTDEQITKILIDYDLPELSINIDSEKNFDYLINMQIRSLTKKKIDELQKLYDSKTESFNIVTNTSIKQMWKNDLKEFKKQYILDLNSYENEAFGKIITNI